MNRQAQWYDEHYYKGVNLEMGPWYRLLLPDLIRHVNPKTRLLELGCGQATLLTLLAQEGLVREENLHGVDQSSEAIRYAQQRLPRAHLAVRDIYEIDCPTGMFDVCLLMETIEHLEDPQSALAQIYRVLAPGGLLYLSFPNYLYLPWLLVRLLSDLLKKPSWIGRQPIDRIHTVFSVRRLVGRAGFVFERGIGCTYGLPLLYRYETDGLTRSLNRLGLWWLSFHPVMIFRKAAPAGTIPS